MRETAQPLHPADRSEAPLEALRCTGLPLDVDPSRGRYDAQLTAGIGRAIVDGRLRAGERLPSARRLATALGISRNAVATAYAELGRQRLVTTRHGAGTFVGKPSGSGTGRPAVQGDVPWLRGGIGQPPRDREVPIDLRLRSGTIAPLASDAWRRAWRIATATVDQTYGDPRGPEDVRVAIAEHVGRTRGVPCVAEDVVVTSGASDALSLLLRATLRPGDALGFEDPGYPGLTHIAAVHRVPLVAVDVDDDGMVVAALERARPAPLAVHVTPSHQFPLGVELSEPRRAALIEWAQRRGGLVIENDYDGEFRFGPRSAPALTATDITGHVCLVGTFSRLIAPSLRVGYLVATPALADRVADLKRELDEYPSLPSQLAVAQLIRSGEAERHLRRVRRLASLKRARVQAALGGLDGVTLHGLAGGLHVRIELSTERDVEDAAVELRSHGIHVDQLRDFSWRPSSRDALLVDYGRPSLTTLERALGTLATVLARG